MTREKAREEIENAIGIEIDSGLEVMPAVNDGNVINQLPAFDGRFARAEVVAADEQETIAGIDLRFGVRAVCQARFAGLAASTPAASAASVTLVPRVSPRAIWSWAQ